MPSVLIISGGPGMMGLLLNVHHRFSILEAYLIIILPLSLRILRDLRASSVMQPILVLTRETIVMFIPIIQFMLIHLLPPEIKREKIGKMPLQTFKVP